MAPYISVLAIGWCNVYGLMRSSLRRLIQLIVSRLIADHFGDNCPDECFIDPLTRLNMHERLMTCRWFAGNRRANGFGE